MKSYKAYGLVFSSDIALPELATAEEPPVAFIRVQPLSEEPPCESAGGSCLEGRVLDALRFRVRDGRSITVEPLRKIEEEEIRVYVLGVLMSILLRQRGLLVIHASALVKQGQAVAFVGDSGWGKSTLAGFFVQAGGYELLNDDVMALKMDQVPIHVLPGFAQIKLRPEAEHWLAEEYSTLPALHANSPKRVATPRQFFHSEEVPLARIYLLEPEAREKSAVVDIAPRNTLLELISHTRVTNVMTEPEIQARHFLQCQHLLQRVQVKRLERKRDLNALGDILQVVERDLAQGQAS